MSALSSRQDVLERRARRLAELRAKRAEIGREYQKLGKEIAEVEDDLLKRMDFDSFRMRDAGPLVSKTKRVVPQLTDPNAFFEHVRKTREFDLLNRQVNSTAYRERIEAGEKIPGVESFTKVGISIRNPTKHAKPDVRTRRPRKKVARKES